MAAREKHRSHILLRKQPPVDWLSTLKGEVQVRLLTISTKITVCSF